MYTDILPPNERERQERHEDGRYKELGNDKVDIRQDIQDDEDVLNVESWPVKRTLRNISHRNIVDWQGSMLAVYYYF